MDSVAFRSDCAYTHADPEQHCPHMKLCPFERSTGETQVYSTIFVLCNDRFLYFMWNLRQSSALKSGNDYQ